MHKLIPIKFIARLMLLVIFLLSVYGLHESVHAMQSHVTASEASSNAKGECFAPHQCPCSTPDDHKSCDGTGCSMNCSCHAPLPVNLLLIKYDPVVTELLFSESFRHIPEVYFPKFVPPQNLA